MGKIGWLQGNRLPMLIVPALIVAILCGSLAAVASLIAGYGWLNALVAYWVVGNLALMAFLIPRLLAKPCEGCPFASEPSGRRPIARVILAAGWVTLGLAMVFWQAFNSDAGMTRGPHTDSLGSMLGAVSGDLLAQGPPSAQRDDDGLLLRIDPWIIGVVLYIYGMLRLFSVTASATMRTGQG